MSASDMLDYSTGVANRTNRRSAALGCDMSNDFMQLALLAANDNCDLRGVSEYKTFLHFANPSVAEAPYRTAATLVTLR